MEHQIMKTVRSGATAIVVVEPSASIRTPVSLRVMPVEMISEILGVVIFTSSQVKISEWKH